MKKFVGLIIVVLVVWGLVTMAQRWGTLPEYESLVAEDDAVLVVDQQPSEDVVVSYAKLSQPGYVLVYGDNTATGLPMVLGTSALLSAGEHRGITIHHGKNYSGRVTAKVAHDDGDGIFDAAVDQAVLADDGAEVSSDAALDVAAEADVELTDEELAAELEAEGYEIVVEEEVSEEMVEDDGSMTEDEPVTDDGSMSDATTTEEAATSSDEGVAN